MRPIILITRPEMAGLKFADQLRARLGCNIPIAMSPILRIEFSGALPDLRDIATLIFTSSNGVAAYCQLTERRDIPCICVGDATMVQAQAAGMAARSCGGTADDLVARLMAEDVPGPCLHIRGEHGVGDVAGRLHRAGIPTSEAVLYQQCPEELTTQAKALLQGEEVVFLPLFSPRSARLVFSSVQITAPIRVVALSEKVAACVPDTFSDAVIVSQRPDADAMLEVIEALVGTGKPLEGKNLAQ